MLADLCGIEVGDTPAQDDLAAGQHHAMLGQLEREIEVLLDEENRHPPLEQHAQDPRLLLLDEPVAGMSDEETARTGELLESLAGRHSVVVVEHDMHFVESIAQKVTVLHEGRLLAEGTLDVVREDPRVVDVYLGR